MYCRRLLIHKVCRKSLAEPTVWDLCTARRGTIRSERTCPTEKLSHYAPASGDSYVALTEMPSVGSPRIEADKTQGIYNSMNKPGHTFIGKCQDIDISWCDVGYNSFFFTTFSNNSCYLLSDFFLYGLYNHHSQWPDCCRVRSPGYTQVLGQSFELYFSCLWPLWRRRALSSALQGRELRH